MSVAHVGVALIAITVAQSAPSLTGVVRAARDYVSAYQQQFDFLIADQRSHQTVLERDAVTGRRDTQGELFTAFVDDARGWMSVQDITVVDGRSVERPEPTADRLRSRRGLTGRDVAAANAQHNLGRITRNFGEPTLALQLLMASRATDVTFTRRAVDVRDSATTLVTLELRLRREATFVRSQRGHVVTSGEVVVELPTGRIHRTRLSFDDGQVHATVATEFIFDPRLGVMVPATLEERYVARSTSESVTVHTTYSNYRRFEGEGRLVDGPRRAP